MSQPRGLREHPSDVQRRDGDDPELHAPDADDQLRQVARREMELLRPSGITCETHRRDIGNPGMKMPRGATASRSPPRSIRGGRQRSFPRTRIWQSKEWSRYV